MWILVVALAGLGLRGSPAQESGLRLAEIPADLEPASDLVPTSSLGTFRQRSSLGWSADGTRVAYAGRRGDEWFPVVGERVGEAFVYVGRPHLLGGSVFFHVVRNQSASHQLSWIWIDGELVGPEDWLGELAVDAEGRQVAFWTQPGARVGSAEESRSHDVFLTLAQRTRADTWSVSRPKQSFLREDLVAPSFTRDGRRVLAIARDGGGWHVIERAGARIVELTDRSAQIVNLAVSADGKAFAHTVRGGEGEAPELFFRGKRVGRTHASQHALAVDAAGKRVAYVADVGGRASAAVGGGGTQQALYDHVLELVFRPDGAALAFSANREGAFSTQVPGQVEGGRSSVVVRPATSTGAWSEGPAYLEVRDLVWSADGARLAYCARDGEGWRVVCGELHSQSYTDVGAPVFAADGSALHFGARQDRLLLWQRLELP